MGRPLHHVGVPDGRGIPVGGSHFLNQTAVAQIGPGAAGQTISLMPLFGALLAVTLLAEPLEPYHAAAVPLILGGVTMEGLSSV